MQYFINNQEKNNEKVMTRYILTDGNDNKLFLQINNDNAFFFFRKKGTTERVVFMR